ncbi:MAG: nuclear transport factor 2 family protein [Firmicutes bacterium]|nr:nuclear transport factor 2 family protein [Bacillota bacterium]
MGFTDELRKKLLLTVSTVGVSVILVAIVIVAAVSPPSPEAVVNDFVAAIRSGDGEKMEQLTEGEALAQLGDTTVLDVEQSQPWYNLKTNGEEIYREFRIGEVEVSNDTARIVVFYGAGLFQEHEYYLLRRDKAWKIYDIR